MSNVMLITETKLKRLTIHIICDGQFSKKPLQNLSSQKILSDSPHSDSCRTRNIARVALPLLLPSFHYSTELPKHRLLMLMLLTESQLLSKVLWYLCCTELKEPRGPGTVWQGGQLSIITLCSALTIFPNKRGSKTYGTQKCSACVNSYIRENKNLLQHLQRAGLIINTKFLSFLQNYFSY